MAESSQTIYHYYPKRLAWIGTLILGSAVLCGLFFIWLINVEDSFSIVSTKKKEKNASSALSFSIGLKEQIPSLSIPNLQGLMTFSFDPVRPQGDQNGGKQLLVRINSSGESKKVSLPCRLDLRFGKDHLNFSKDPSLFFVDLSVNDRGQIEGKEFISNLDGAQVEAGNFLVSGQDCPIQGPLEFAEGSAFRLLAEARWWGRDQFQGALESGERLEIGGELLEIKEKDWLIWKNGRWEKCLFLEKEDTIAHIQSILPKSLVLEGWDSHRYVRIAPSSTIIQSFKIKAEDLFSSIRIRSEKQISCTLEKQCMILKIGDWVLKTGGRWKILRKKDERDAFLNGKLFGELFILERISQKQGQKMIQGRLFNPGRTQVVSIEMAASSNRKLANKDLRKGRSP